MDDLAATVFVNVSAYHGFIAGIATFILVTCASAGLDFIFDLVHKYRLKWRGRGHAHEGGEK